MATFKLTTPTDTKVKTACEQCANDTSHDVLADYEMNDSSPDGDVHIGESHQLIRCRGCESVSFRKTFWNSEDAEWDFEEQTQTAVTREEIYPRRLRGRKPIDAHRLPSRVRAVYDETRAAMSNDHRILGGIGVRALVEAVCAEKKTQGKDLEKRIDDLVRLGVLTQDGADVLHGTRLVGNVAAHEATPPSFDTLRAALDIAEHLLNTVYVIPNIAAVLPKRRPKGGPSPAITAPKAPAPHRAKKP